MNFLCGNCNKELKVSGKENVWNYWQDIAWKFNLSEILYYYCYVYKLSDFKNDKTTGKSPKCSVRCIHFLRITSTDLQEKEDHVPPITEPPGRG